MRVVKDKEFSVKLFNILKFIAKDKKSATIKFEMELERKIESITTFPYKYRKSVYFDDEAYRDLIHMGYTIIYKVQDDTIVILEIFKWQSR